ncbi:hypothetical protein OF83DRAFT_335656 [Amylostereum chailletii]|nr:hypothetical protein OF83DRAFT_335656 [Amylostereum chailletii]
MAVKQLPSPTLSSEDKRFYIVKVHWADTTRIPEQSIIERPQQEASNPDVQDHTPYVLGWKNCSSFATKRIRQSLATQSTPSSTSSAQRAVPRILRIIVFERLGKVQMLDGRGMMTAILQCVRCHYALWRAGIHHNDLSKNNIMYRVKHGKVCGVVNDWDSATIPGSRPEALERTGTRVFMPLLFLLDDSDLFARKYCPDNESFIWVMTWLFPRYGRDGIENPPLNEWLTYGRDNSRCFRKVIKQKDRLYILRRTPWSMEWSITITLLIWLDDVQLAEQRRLGPPRRTCARSVVAQIAMLWSRKQGKC